jgi:hypothetical protein
MDEGDLSPDIPFFDSFNLTFPNHIHCLKSSEGATSRVERVKPHPWFGESFDEAMVLLNQPSTIPTRSRALMVVLLLELKACVS